MAGSVEAGKRVGRYFLTGRVGAGGFAEVWRAQDDLLGRAVAVKIAWPGLAESADFVTRFLREARLAARLDHPGILAIHDIGTHDGRPYLVMPFVPGGTLETHLSPLPSVPLALDWLAQLAAALDFAHGEKVVHRDVKPGNALFDRRGRLILADFGIGRSLEETAGLTRTGASIGTPAYMSPEQIRADPVGCPVGPASDQFGLGVVAFRMLTGGFPFEGITPVLMQRIVHGHPTLPSALRKDLPPFLDEAFERVFAKAPGDRFGSCEEFAAALGRSFALDLVRRGGDPLVGGGAPRVPVEGEPGEPERAVVYGRSGTEILDAPVAALRLGLPGGVAMDFELVPAGTFEMGAAEGEAESYFTERPVHEVTISAPYWVGRCLVTLEQWHAVTGECPAGYPADNGRMPVRGVSWNDVCRREGSFLARLNAHLRATGQAEGDAVRVPSEAEWEHAARGGIGARFSFGNASPSPNGEGEALASLYAWHKGNSPDGPRPVATRRSNPFGLYDVHGNLWEWCLDGWGAYRPGPSVDPVGAPSRLGRVIRGGAWSYEVHRARSASRAFAGEDDRSASIGLRLVRPAADRQAPSGRAPGARSEREPA